MANSVPNVWPTALIPDQCDPSGFQSCKLQHGVSSVLYEAVVVGDVGRSGIRPAQRHDPTEKLDIGRIPCKMEV